MLAWLHRCACKRCVSSNQRVNRRLHEQQASCHRRLFSWLLVFWLPTSWRVLLQARLL